MSLASNKLSPIEAYEELMRFAGKRGEAALRLAFHAAVPQSFRLDLLHLIKRNFVPEAKNDPTAEADLLLSPLCKDIGRGYFQFDSNVRYLLLDNLAETYAAEPVPRIRRVANFLLWYVNYSARFTSGGGDRLWREYLETQRWVALAFINPENAAAQLAECLQRTVNENDVVTRIQLGGLAASLSAPLVGYSHLLNYASALQSLETEGWEEAQKKFGDFLKEKITVGGVELRPVFEIAGATPESPEEATPESPEETPTDEAPTDEAPFETAIIGQSPAILRVIETARAVARTNLPVLIQGESGTGKELFARTIHDNSERRDKPFISVNCSAIPVDLLESELFGHDAVTWTGEQHKGRFEEADGGTLFLDEITETNSLFQIKLLQTLMESVVRPIGSEQSIKINVRLITAANRNLEEEVKNGRLRQDLMYRLNAATINLPPLRERREDIEPLVFHFLERYKENTERSVAGISDEALRALKDYDFPGNIRELRNVIERAVIIASERRIELEDLPDVINKKVKKAYAYDVFVSYSSRDNVVLSGESGWVTYFRKTLENFLSQNFGRNAKIWQDDSMTAGYRWEESAREAITDSQVFIPILSPGYLNSEWCLKELEMFASQMKDSRRRIFPVVKTPVKDLPPMLSDILYMEFFKRDESGNYLHGLDPTMGQEFRNDFFLKVSDLAYEIAESIRIIETGESSPNYLHSVYFPPPTRDLMQQYANIRRDLEQRNIRILPPLGEQNPPYEKIREGMKDCDLVIHLIGNEPGGFSEGNKSYLQLQIEVAAELAREQEFKHIIWIPENLEIKDDEHQLFVNRLPEMSSNRVEVLRTSLEDLKHIIVDVLRHEKAFPLSSEAKDKWIYVLFDRSDLREVHNLESRLYESGYPVLSSRDYLERALSGDSEINVHEVHNDYLTRCDAVIIYWNNAPLNWVRKTVFDLQRAKSMRERDFLAQAVFCDGDLQQKAVLRVPPPPNLVKINGFAELPRFFDRLESKTQSSEENYPS